MYNQASILHIPYFTDYDSASASQRLIRCAKLTDPARAGIVIRTSCRVRKQKAATQGSEGWKRHYWHIQFFVVRAQLWPV
jgi:hypothetical protein